ncbi:MAG: riboflavin synthase [Crocinitomicaceae bacterium]|nr:riboflavin synthase [Taishania sp.]
MFTGIIEQIGTVKNITKEGENIHFELTADFVGELKIDQSVAHNGCCLTVVQLTDSTYTVTAIKETLDRTNLGDWTVGTQVNLERCMVMNGRLDGHIVQGHVDTTAICRSIENQNGSWKFVFDYATDDVTVEKGSITINGTSLTVVDSNPGSFSVCIIPYTFEYTNINQLKIGDKVNLEFDIIGKYVAKLLGRK